MISARVLPAALLLIAAPAFAGEDPRVGWKGRSYVMDRLPADFPAQARAAVEAWSPWVTEHGYRMDLDASGRVLLVTAHSRSRVKGELDLVEETGKLFDRILPAPERLGDGEAFEFPDLLGDASEDPEGGSPIPEDPEEAPAGLQPRPEEDEPERRTAAAPVASWGTGSLEPDTQAAVMLVLKSEGDYVSALEFLAGLQPYLKEWSQEARRHSGFAIEMPLCGAYNEHAAGMEEWDPDNELVHRVMRLLVMRGFGQPPYWLAAGLSWYAELTVRKTVYCFPYRTGFVGVGEHGGWDAWLRSTFGDRKRDPVTMAELGALQRGTYEDDAARLAWGVVEFIARRHPQAFPALLEDLRLLRDLDDRVQAADGTWMRRPGYESPVEKQETLFRRHLGARFTEDIVGFWRSFSTTGG